MPTLKDRFVSDAKAAAEESRESFNTSQQEQYDDCVANIEPKTTEDRIADLEDCYSEAEGAVVDMRIDKFTVSQRRVW